MRTIKNNDLNNELDELLSKTSKLKEELNQAETEEEKLRIKEDFLALKKQMDILEQDITVKSSVVPIESVTEENDVSKQIPIPTQENLYAGKTVNVAESLSKQVIDENILNDVKEIASQPTILQFLKDNLKLLIFSSFVFIGIVWLFVYITSLTNSSKEIQVATGFAVSIVLMILPFIKNVKQLTNVILSSVGYIIGLFTLLLGSVIFEILPLMVSVAISAGYLVFGVYKVKQLKSEFFNIIIIFSSLLLTFAYYYVSAPFEILYIYIIVLILLFSLILTENNKISALCLLYGSVFITTVLTSLLDNAIWDKVYGYDSDETFIMDYSDIYGYVIQNDFKFVFMYPSIVLIALLFGIYQLKSKLTGKFEIGYKIFLGSLYLWIFSYLMFLSDTLYRIESNMGIVIFSSLIVLGILIILLNIKFKEFKEYFAVGIFLTSLASLYLIDSISTNYYFDAFCQLSLIAILLIFGLYQKIDSLKLVGIVANLAGFLRVLDVHGFGFHNELSGELPATLIVVYYLAINILIFYMYKKKLVENSGFIESKLDKILSGNNQLFLQIYAIYISLILVFVGYYFTSFIYSFFNIYLIFIDIAILLLVAISIWIINMNNDSEHKKFFTPLFVSSNIIMFGYMFLSFMYFSILGSKVELGLVNILDFILVALYLNYIYTLITKLNSVPLLNNLVGKLDKEIIVRLPLILFTGLILGTYLKGTLPLDIVYSVIFGLSVVYMVYELSILDKSEVNNAILKVCIYLIVAVYLLILVFVLLSDVSFIIKGLIFLLIGVYGIYTVIKKN